MYERLFVDNVIDRFYIKYRTRYEPYRLMDVLHTHIKTVFTNQNVPREYIKDRVVKLWNYQDQLKNLIELPKLEQRSPEWYNARQNLITASDFAQALGKGKFGTQKQFFQKKCGYEPDNFDSSAPALRWGVMYESVAIDAYAAKNGTQMYEFGLLIHPEKHMKWFGASPDSITELGIMVEIKCPWRRKITGEIPEQYYYQMQGQLDVCGLTECDYLECEFVEYDNKEDFVRHFADNPNEKGIIIEYLHDNTTKYVYSPFAACHNVHGLVGWLEKEYETVAAKHSVTKVHFWQLHTYSVVRVYKNDEFLNANFPLLKQVWDKIMSYKADRALYDSQVCCVMPSKKQEPRLTLNLDDFTATASASAPVPLRAPAPSPASALTGSPLPTDKDKWAGYSFLPSDED